MIRMEQEAYLLCLPNLVWIPFKAIDNSNIHTSTLFLCWFFSYILCVWWVLTYVHNFLCVFSKISRLCGIKYQFTVSSFVLILEVKLLREKKLLKTLEVLLVEKSNILYPYIRRSTIRHFAVYAYTKLKFTQS